MYHYVVRQKFGTYKPGQVITDEDVGESLMRGPTKRNLVRIIPKPKKEKVATVTKPEPAPDAQEGKPFFPKK